MHTRHILLVKNVGYINYKIYCCLQVYTVSPLALNGAGNRKYRNESFLHHHACHQLKLGILFLLYILSKLMQCNRFKFHCTVVNTNANKMSEQTNSPDQLKIQLQSWNGACIFWNKILSQLQFLPDDTPLNDFSVALPSHSLYPTSLHCTASLPS